MGGQALAGALLVSFGPGAVLFFDVVARKPFLMLVCVARHVRRRSTAPLTRPLTRAPPRSAAVYLLSLLVAALPWRGALVGAHADRRCLD